MVARGDLGVEIGPALVPLLQKRIILAALERAQPVITATQMLESMIHHADPTRAEASDVANAILDGSSALMLSGETAIGEYPVEAVAYMDRIARAVEPSLDYRHELPEASDEPTVGQAMSNAACDIAESLRREGDPRSDLHGADGLGGGAAPSPQAGPRALAPRLRAPADGDRVGRDADAIEEASDVEDLWAKSLGAARAGGYVDRAICRDHRGHRGQPPGTTDVIKVEQA